jgi:hypothetical protein
MWPVIDRCKRLGATEGIDIIAVTSFRASSTASEVQKWEMAVTQDAGPQYLVALHTNVHKHCSVFPTELLRFIRICSEIYIYMCVYIHIYVWVYIYIKLQLGFSPRGCSTTIGQNRQVTHITHIQSTLKQNTIKKYNKIHY